MIHAYDKIYLEKARTSLASVLDFSTNQLHWNISAFFELFSTSHIATLFESGDVNTIAGKSGIELVYEVLDQSGIKTQRITPLYYGHRSKEFWTGWALAYYQWESALSFSEIVHFVPISDIVSMYTPFHEMDIQHFVNQMNVLIGNSKKSTNLQLLRQKAGLTQKQLAQLSNVPIRTIQQYEQKQKNINKAQAEYIFRLANALHCNPIDLIEHTYIK